MDSNKTQLLLLVCFLATLTQAGISFYLPSLPEISQAFSSKTFASSTLSAYLFGYAAPMLFWGYLTEKLGPKYTLLTLTLLFAISSAILSISPAKILFILSRCIQGACSGGCIIIGRSLLKNYYSGPQLAKVMSIISIAFVCSTAFYQILGGYISYHFSWHIIFLMMSILGLWGTIFTFLTLPAATQRKQTLSLFRSCQAYQSLITNRRFLLMLISGGTGSAIIMVFNTVSPFIFRHIFNFSTIEYGYISLFIVLPYLFGSIINIKLSTSDKMYDIAKFGQYAIITSGIILLIASIFNSLTAYLLLSTFSVTIFGISLIYPNVISLAVTNAKEEASFAFSLFGFFQQVTAFSLSLIAAIFVNEARQALITCILFIGLISLASFIYVAKKIN